MKTSAKIINFVNMDFVVHNGTLNGQKKDNMPLEVDFRENLYILYKVYINK